MRGRGEGSIRQRRKADGTVYWEARVRINGPQVSFYADSKSGAQALARQAKSDAERGVVHATATMTVEENLPIWFERVRPTIRARTYATYRELARIYIVPTIGRVRLARLTPGHVTAMLARVVESGRSESTAKRVRAVLSAALRAAQLDIGLPRNVARLAALPKSDQPAFAPEVITPEQAWGILATFSGHRIEPLVLFSVATGVRHGALLALRWQDIDIPGRTVTITHAVDAQGSHRVLARPKSDRAQRSIALGDLALHALELRREQEAGDRLLAGAAWQDLDYVFPNPTGGLRDRGALRRTFQRRLEAVGLPRIRWHALRRVFAALLQDQGVPLERIRDLMGHSELRVTEGYAYTMPETLRRDVSAIDSALNEGRMRVETASGATRASIRTTSNKQKSPP